MTTTDTSEKGLESLIVSSLTGVLQKSGEPGLGISESSAPYGVAGYVRGDPKDFDRDHAVDVPKLFEFFQATQPVEFESLNLTNEGQSRQQFLHRIQGEIAKRGIIDVLRKGVKHGPVSVNLFYGTPTPGNQTAATLYAANIFSITRQLRYSKDETQLALDLGIFINGLPIITFELKNQLTKQTFDDAITQYKRDRDPKELLFQFGRCIVPFALDDSQAWMCTQLRGRASWFLPFNKGFNNGAGNPPNPNGLATDYLWKEVLAKDSLTNIIENYAQVVEETDEKGRKRKKQIFPRYHQLDVVREMLVDAQTEGPGKRYLIQHSTGSGKSNSIAWLAHQLVELKKDGKPVFDSIIVITDRRLLDRQIRDNIKQFAQVSAVVGAVTQGSSQLKEFIEQGKKIIISTIQKFPIILDEIGDQHRNRRFAIIVDEAHSSQGGRTAAKMNVALSAASEEEEETDEDRINQIIETKKMLPNASYFAFTATPKNKTLELDGIRRAMQYKTAFDAYLSERKSPWKAIVAFSGEHDYNGEQNVTEARMNGFPSSLIPERFREDPYRFLIVADKFQTGYDEPLLHTMYCDKHLSGVRAVQTLSRLNRAHPQKHDTFVLDFMNDADTIQEAFEPYYLTTVLSEATDPNKLHDLKSDLDGYQVYTWHDVEQVTSLYINGADVDQLHPYLDASVAIYNADLDEDGQVDFKSKAKAFLRTYNFLASILPYSLADWERLSIFLNFLVPKLPAPKEDDLSKGILETIDMDSYRVEVKAQLEISLPDEETPIGPVPAAAGGHMPEPELDRLSIIVRSFNDLFGNIDWKDKDKIEKVISEEIPAKVAVNIAYQNAKMNSDKQNARIEHDKSLGHVMIDLLADHTDLYKLFSDDPSFKKWLADMVFATTYD